MSERTQESLGESQDEYPQQGRTPFLHLNPPRTGIRVGPSPPIARNPVKRAVNR